MQNTQPFVPIEDSFDEQIKSNDNSLLEVIFVCLGMTCIKPRSNQTRSFRNFGGGGLVLAFRDEKMDVILPAKLRLVVWHTRSTRRQRFGSSLPGSTQGPAHSLEGDANMDRGA